MKIETDFDIGERVWVVEINNSGIPVIEVMSEKISSISINGNDVLYFFDKWCCEYKKENLVAYNDTHKLMEKIKELDNIIYDK